MKTSRLDLEVVDASEKNTPSTTTFDKLILPDELPSIEEELKTLVGALKGLETPKLDKTDVLRLHNIIQGVKVYQELITQHVDYRGLEAELSEWREKYAILTKRLRNLTEIGLIEETKPTQKGAPASYKLCIKVFLAMVLEENRMQDIFNKATDIQSAQILLTLNVILSEKKLK